MSIETKQKTLKISLTEAPRGFFTSKVVGEETKHAEDEKVLRLYFSLVGETSPAPSPLSTDEMKIYRYDWMVGATLVKPWYKWDWFNQISAQRAVVVQLLIDPGQSGYSFSETNAFLLGLLPSLDTSSWFERNAERLGDSLAKLADATEPMNKTVTNMLKVSSVMSNFISSSEGRRKNWFIYRFLDEERKCCAIEWNIHRSVLHQYGPLLRGSLLLAFHGSGQPASPLKLLLRPRLNFGKDQRDFNYLPDVSALESENPVELSIKPTAG